MTHGTCGEQSVQVPRRGLVDWTAQEEPATAFGREIVRMGVSVRSCRRVCCEVDDLGFVGGVAVISLNCLLSV